MAGEEEADGVERLLQPLGRQPRLDRRQPDGILGRRTCIEAALSMDPGIRVNDIADAFTRVTSILDKRFPAGADEAAAIKRYFSDWADELGAT